MYIVLTVHLDFICIKLFGILTLRQWHPHPTTGQVLQSSPTPDLVSEEEEEGQFYWWKKHYKPNQTI
jgi:hypothetical protein